MNGREKIEAAFSLEGTPEIPVLICYEHILVRDKWSQLTGKPWWYQASPDINQQLEWKKDIIESIGHDFFELPIGYPLSSRNHVSIKLEGDEVYLFDDRNGSKEKIERPVVGGTSNTRKDIVTGGRLFYCANYILSKKQINNLEEFDEWIKNCSMKLIKETLTDGSLDLPVMMSEKWGQSLCPMSYVPGPLSTCFSLWGFEDTMIMFIEKPDIIHHACNLFTNLSLQCISLFKMAGVKAIWVDDCYTDMIDPSHYKIFNLPYLRKITEEINFSGMKSIHYFGGNPKNKHGLLLDTGADAISLEESKKGFDIDIESTIEWVNKKKVVLGNLDSIHILENGNEDELRREILRQIRAGRKNGGRFIMSLGSPVTPNTPVSRVSKYCDLTHDLSKR